MNRKIILANLCLLLACAGCASPQEAATRDKQRVDSTCIARGLQPETKEFADCVMQERASEDKRLDELKRMQQQQKLQQQLDATRPRRPM